MLRRTYVAYKLSAFALFTKESYPAMKELSFGERARQTALAYKALSADEKAALKARACLQDTSSSHSATRTGAPRNHRREAPAALIAYRRFSQEHFATLDGSFAERSKQVAAMWSALSKRRRSALVAQLRRRRPPTAYSLFTKEHYPELEGTFEERAAKIAEMWKAQKNSNSK